MKTPGLLIDWSAAIQEGHWTTFNGRMLESLSDISVVDPTGKPVAEGWMDFVITESAPNSEPRVFWLFLSILSEEGWSRVKEDPFLPRHLWEALTDNERKRLAMTDSKWLNRDPKLAAWKRDQLRQ